MNVNRDVIRKEIKKLKRRKAGDSEGCRNEMIIEGEEMVKSVWLLFREILSKMEIPNQWEEVKVKSIYKNNGKTHLR